MSGRIQLLNKLRQEALDLEMQMEKQRKETAEKQEDINNLQVAIESLDSKDPKHVSKYKILTCSMETEDSVSVVRVLSFLMAEPVLVS